MKTIDVLGVTVKDFPLKELLKKASDSLTEPGVQTLSWLSANVLLSVGENIEQREWIDSLDLMICNQAGLLKSGRAAGQLHKDGKSEDFMSTFLKYLGSNGSSIATVCDEEERAIRFDEFICEFSDRLNITERALINNADKLDDLNNRLNEIGPRVVLTCVPWNLQGPMFEAAKRVSNASLWIAFLPEMVDEMSGSRDKKTEAFFERFLFGRKVASYEKESN